MKQEDIEKLRLQLEKGGFPFELEVSREFVKNNWDVLNNTYYIDKDENKGREIDLLANYTKQHQTNGHYTECTFTFVVEIKKELEKPWVVFTTDTMHFEKLIHDIHRDKVHNNFDRHLLSKSFQKHNQKLNERLGRSFTEGFSTSKRDKIFTSLCNVTKAFIHKLESIEKDSSQDSILYYFEPLVILNGQLFEAFLDENDKLKVDKKEYLQVRFNYMSNFYKERTTGYLINVVTKEYLSKYIKLRMEQFDKIFETNKQGK